MHRGLGEEECREEFKEEVGFATLTVSRSRVKVLMLLDGEALRPAATACSFPGGSRRCRRSWYRGEDSLRPFALSFPNP